jgi:hypothetical protein
VKYHARSELGGRIYRFEDRDVQVNFDDPHVKLMITHDSPKLVFLFQSARADPDVFEHAELTGDLATASETKKLAARLLPIATQIARDLARGGQSSFGKLSSEQDSE